MHVSVILTHIQYFLNCLCLYVTNCVYLDPRQDSHCDIIFCVFAYLLEKTRSHESPFQWHDILFLFGVLFIRKN